MTYIRSNTKILSPKLILIFVVYCCITALHASVLAGVTKTKEFDSLKNPINVKHLTLDLRFDWTQKKAIGTAEIHLSPLKSTKMIALDAGLLAINFIKLSNSALLKYDYDGGDKNDNLHIYLDRLYTPGEKILLTISYQTNHINHADPNSIWGSFGKGLRFQGPTSTTPTKRKQIWSSGEPMGNKYWFPCNDDIEDLHTTHLTATVEKPLTVISNGILTTLTDNHDNTRTFQYKTDKPFPSYLVSLVVGEYREILQICETKTIHQYGYPDEVEAVKATTELVPDMMRFLEEKTGYAYPFKTYSQVVVQDYPFPGLVGQHTFSILSDNYIDDYGVHKDFKYLWDGVALQALANQWFGNLIMPASWSDVWLNNAFAQYFAGLFTEKDNGSSEYLLNYLPFEKSAVVADWYSDNIHPIATPSYTDLTNFTSDNYSKFRGALVLRMLQNELGDKNWWLAVQRYVSKNAFRQVTTKDFQYAVEAVTGQSYQWFFDQWVYQIGLPKLEITKKYDLAKKALVLSIKQNQRLENKTPYPQINYFRGKINLDIDNNTKTLRLEPKAENKYTLAMDKEPGYVHLNVGETFLCEMNYQQNTYEYLNQLRYSNDVLARKKAMDSLVTIVKEKDSNQEIISRIKEAFEKEIQSPNYWRYRLYALGSLRKISPLPYDTHVKSLLVQLIKKETSWFKTSAISMLGLSNDSAYVDLYIHALNDSSDRVVNAAAIALGKTKHSQAFDILLKLDKKPSWKNQSRISALNGLQELGDARAVDYVMSCIEDNRSPRWYLATPVWDYPYAAVNALVSFKQGHLAYPILFERFRQALEENDLNDLFQNVQLIDLLKDERAKEMYSLLKKKFIDNKTVLEAIQVYETNYLESLSVQK